VAAGDAFVCCAKPRLNDGAEGDGALGAARFEICVTLRAFLDRLCAEFGFEIVLADDCTT
jgi:hypothetical protein